MEEVLRALYKLQQIDLELDELNDGGGDLPTEIEVLQQKANDFTVLIDREEEKLRALREERSGSSTAIENMRQRLKDLNERLRTVRNNKEYEATTNEISAAELELQTMERSIQTHNSQEATYIRDIETLSKQRDEITRELEEKNDTLGTIRETHADEIKELREAKEEALKQIDQELLKRYSHIRTAHNDAVVKVRKGACSGCYRGIPPQTIVEMRRNEQIYMCEFCGRMLVDEDIAATVTIE